MSNRLQGFIRTHSSVKTEERDSAGNQVIKYTLVPRGLVSMLGKEWKDDEYLIKMLKPTIGDRVYETRDGHFIRDLFFAGVQGEVNPHTGKRYAWLKAGQIWSTAKPDPETGDIRGIWWLVLGKQEPWGNQRGAESSEDGSSSDSDATRASEEVETA